MTMVANKPIRFDQFHAGAWEPVDAETIVEAPVSLSVNGDLWLTFLCTPIDLEAMGVGFLFNEGLIHYREEIASVKVCDSGENIDIWLHQNLKKPENWRRTSGCTGGATAANVEEEPVPELDHHFELTPDQVFSLIEQLFQAQTLYRRSGGVHTSALSDGQKIQIAMEDIGRHNTLDKIAGRSLLGGLEAGPRVLLTTGRISSEMLQKASRMKASIVISRTSPSSLSIQLAERWGITLIGYAHRNRFNVYTHPERLTSANSQA
jgi:FdhD protein